MDREGRKFVRKLLDMSSTKREMAVCLPFMAMQLSLSDNASQAVMLLALAYRHPIVGEGWIGLHPNLEKLQQSLRSRLSQEKFSQAWTEGEQLDLYTTVTELKKNLYSI